MLRLDRRVPGRIAYGEAGNGLAAVTVRFCMRCGHRLEPPAAPDGERKLITVLFADIKGSMELMAERDPVEARRLLDPVLTR